MKAIINMTTAFLLLLLFLFGYSLVTYTDSPEKYQWLDINGEFKTSSYNVTVSYNLDTPLDDLNGYSLKEVFEDENLIINGDFSTDISGWSALNATISFNNGMLEYSNAINSNSRVGRSLNIIDDHTYYFNWFFDTQDTILSSKIYLGQYRTVSKDNGFNSYLGTSTTNYTGLIHRIMFSSTSESVLIDNYHALDLTYLGINQTQEEMDYWYSEYQKLQNNQVENYQELGGTVETSWQFLTGYLTSFVDIVDAQVNILLNPLKALTDGLSIITVPIFGI